MRVSAYCPYICVLMLEHTIHTFVSILQYTYTQRDAAAKPALAALQQLERAGRVNRSVLLAGM